MAKIRSTNRATKEPKRFFAGFLFRLVSKSFCKLCLFSRPIRTYWDSGVSFLLTFGKFTYFIGCKHLTVEPVKKCFIGSSSPPNSVACTIKIINFFETIPTGLFSALNTRRNRSKFF